MQTNLSENLLLILACVLGYCVCAPARSYYNDYPPRGYRRPPPSAYNALYSPYYTPPARNTQVDRYHSSRYRQDYNPTTTTTTTTTTTRRPRTAEDDKRRVDRADAENAKFAGANNQEFDETNGDERTLLLKKKLKKLQRLHRYGNPCLPFGRDASTIGNNYNNDGTTPKPTEQGRFLFDVNIYNTQPAIGGLPHGCGGGGFGGYGGFGYGGGGGGGGLLGGLLSDPIAPVAPIPPYPYRPVSPFATWLSLFAPGVLAATARPYADPGFPLPVNNSQNDPEVDPNYNPVVPVPMRRPPPNRVYYDTAGAPPVTPGQLVGGVATTVNGIIQQLTGNVQPVYQSAYRTSRSYG